MKYSDLTKTQHTAIDCITSQTNNYLIANMGLGKTVVSLTAVSELLAHGVINRVLVIAPLAVARTVWVEEAASWDHLEHLHVVRAVGDIQKRLHVLEDPKNQVVVLNIENVAWFFKHFGAKHGFDALIVDEASKFKEAGSARFKAIRRRLHDFFWRLAMTGTPVSENWEGLYSQIMLADAGESLGTRKQQFKDEFFYQVDFMGYKWELKEGADVAIVNRIQDVVHKTEDYTHELPGLTEKIITIRMPANVKTLYTKLAKDSVLRLHSRRDPVVAANAAVLVGKLQQIANGFIYCTDSETDETDAEDLHGFRLDHMLYEIDRLPKPLIVVYTFRHTLAVLQETIPDAVTLNSQDKEYENNIRKWNSGEIKVLLMHPKSAGHGLNLGRGGCNMLFTCPIWSNDLTKQTIARLWRRGQDKPVNVYTLCTKDSIEEDILMRVNAKESHQVLLDRHLAGV